jgi:hypothetical protein
MRVYPFSGLSDSARLMCSEFVGRLNFALSGSVPVFLVLRHS